MNKILICLLWVGVFFDIAQAQPEWKVNKAINLKKDEFYQIVFQIRTPNIIQKTLFFRWTLHKNNGLVVHLNYDNFPSQFVLYEDYQRNCYTKNLFKAEQKSFGDAPYLMLCFKDYERVKKIAHFKYYIYDGTREFTIIDERKVPNGGFSAY